MGAESSWTRYPRTKTAVRGADSERITLMQQRESWLAFVGTENIVLDAGVTLDLDDVIELVDQIYLPEGWTYEGRNGGTWTRPGWVCGRDDQSLWRVYRTDVPGAAAGSPGVAASNKTFRSADRARRWAEIRLDRTTLNLRGPRPRATQRANMTLPDVRVTAEERTVSVELATRLGLSYSDLARAALELIQREACEGGRLKLARMGNKVSFSIV